MVVIWSDWKRYLLDRGEMQCQGNFKIGWLKEEINLLAAKFTPRRPPYCLLRFSRQHNARAILTVPLPEIYATVGSAIVCDYMETTLCAIVCDLRFRIRDRLRSFAIIWKPAFRKGFLWTIALASDITIGNKGDFTCRFRSFSLLVFSPFGCSKKTWTFFTFTPFHNSRFGPNTVSFRHNEDDKTLLSTTQDKAKWNRRACCALRGQASFRKSGLDWTFGWLGMGRIQRIFIGQMPPKSSCFQIGCHSNGSTFKSVLQITASLHQKK